MLYRLRSRDAPPYLAGTWIDADGTPTPLRPDADHRRPPAPPPRSPAARLPVAWHLAIPDFGLAVDTDAAERAELDGHRLRLLGGSDPRHRQPRRQRLPGDDGLLRCDTEIDASVNVLGEPLKPCSFDPMTGFFRDGCCNTGPQDRGRHTVCVRVTAEFLAFSRDARQRPHHPAPRVRLRRPPPRRPLVPLRRPLAARPGRPAPPPRSSSPAPTAPPSASCRSRSSRQHAMPTRTGLH